MSLNQDARLKLAFHLLKMLISGYWGSKLGFWAGKPSKIKVFNKKNLNLSQGSKWQLKKGEQAEFEDSS